MKYDFEDRINRVINNHQFTCEHRSHYLFVLKGFTPIIDSLTLDLKAYDVSLIPSKENMFITYEDAYLLETDAWATLGEAKYDIWIVDFNFFIDTHASTIASASYAASVQDGDHFWVRYHDNAHLAVRKTLSVFNTINPLIGIVSDFNRLDTNQSRYDYLTA